MADAFDNDSFAVTVTVTRDEADRLLRRDGLDFGDHPRIAPIGDDLGRLTLFLDRRQIDELQSEGYRVEVGENVSAQARERLAEVGEGDRFDGGRLAPTGIGRKGHNDRPASRS